MAGKSDEPQPHPPKDQLLGIAYCIKSPPPWRESLCSQLAILRFFLIISTRSSGTIYNLKEAY